MSEEKDIYKALKACILFFTDATASTVLKSWPNKAPTPSGSDFIYMAIMSQTRQSTNIHEINGAGNQETIYQPVRIPIQIDCFGTKSLEWATILSIVLRDRAGIDFLESYGIVSLFSEDARNLTGIALGDEQNVSRWMVEAEIQRIADVTLATETMTEANVDLIEVYSEYPQ